MEGKNAGVDAEEGVPTQYFNVPVLDIEGVMGCYRRRIDGGLVIWGVGDGEVGQGGDANGRRLSDGGRWRGSFCLWGDD